MAQATEAELAADAAKTKQAVTEHLEGLLGDHDSARLYLCKHEAEQLFRKVQVRGGQGSAADISGLEIPCPELEGVLGRAVVGELRRVLSTLHKSLENARNSAPQDHLTAHGTSATSVAQAPQHLRAEAWVGHEEASDDTLHSSGDSPKAAVAMSPPDMDLLR